MYALPQWASDMLRGSHQQWGVVRARLNGSFIQLENATASGVRDRTVLPIEDGTVQVDGSTPGARRTLSVTLGALPGMWDLVSTVGVELVASSILQAPNGDRVEIPQGVFPIDDLSLGYGVGGRVKITNNPDRWSWIKAGRFFVPRAAPAGMLARSAISSLLLETLPSGSTVTDTSTSTATVPAGVWDRDRDDTIENLATAAGVDVYFDRNGQPAIRNVPTLAQSAAWLVDASASGVLLDATRTRSRTKTYNVVVVTSSKADGSVLFDPVVVWDNDPTSPTYAGPDPVNNPGAAGPFRVRPYFWSSPLLTDATQAAAAARTLLERVRGLAAQLDLTAVPHPGLEDGDVLSVVLPKERADIGRPVETHLADVITIPLNPSRGGTQRIQTRSTRPDSVAA